jgi:hypothetical protein
VPPPAAWPGLRRLRTMPETGFRSRGYALSTPFENWLCLTSLDGNDGDSQPARDDRTSGWASARRIPTSHRCCHVIWDRSSFQASPTRIAKAFHDWAQKGIGWAGWPALMTAWSELPVATRALSEQWCRLTGQLLPYEKRVLPGETLARLTALGHRIAGQPP